MLYNMREIFSSTLILLHQTVSRGKKLVPSSIFKKDSENQKREKKLLLVYYLVVVVILHF